MCLQMLNCVMNCAPTNVTHSHSQCPLLLSFALPSRSLEQGGPEWLHNPGYIRVRNLMRIHVGCRIGVLKEGTSWIALGIALVACWLRVVKPKKMPGALPAR